MERKRLVNRENVRHGFRWRGAFRLRERSGVRATEFTSPRSERRWGLPLVVLLGLSAASCADYESDYKQSVDGYLSGQPKATAAPAGGEAAPTAAPSGGSGGSQPMSYGSGSATGSGSSAGSGSPEGFQTIGSGASGVILPGG